MSSTVFSQIDSKSPRKASTEIRFSSGQLFVANDESVSLVKSAASRNAERICDALYSTEPRLQASESKRMIRGEIAGLREFPERIRSRARVRSRETREESISKCRKTAAMSASGISVSFNR